MLILLDSCLFSLIKLINSGRAWNWVLFPFVNSSSFAMILSSTKSLNVLPSSVATIQSLYFQYYLYYTAMVLPDTFVFYTQGGKTIYQRAAGKTR